MESLAPTLKLALHVRLDLQQGTAIYDSLQNFCIDNQCELSTDLKLWLIQYDKGFESTEYAKHYSEYRKSLFDLLAEGLRGTGVSENLADLEKLMIQECRRQLEEACVLLPYKGLMPLMLFLFPAFLILILSPIFKQFMEVLK